MKQIAHIRFLFTAAFALAAAQSALAAIYWHGNGDGYWESNGDDANGNWVAGAGGNG